MAHHYTNESWSHPPAENKERPAHLIDPEIQPVNDQTWKFFKSMNSRSNPDGSHAQYINESDENVAVLDWRPTVSSVPSVPHHMAFPHVAYPYETRFQTTPHQPLDEAVFQKAHAQYLQKNRASIDEQLLNMDGRLIILYALHREAMQAGGYAALVRRANEDPWSIIAANLGFVNFPANGTEPARSGPDPATRVHHVYCMYLRGFDYAYLMHKHGRIRQNASDVGPSSSGPDQNMNMNGGMLQPNIVQNHPMNPQAQRTPVVGWSAITELLRNMDPGKAQEMLSFASLSREQMQARGVRPDTINLVDTNRPLLQRLSQSQGQFHMSLKAAMSNGQFSTNMPSGGPAPAEQQSSQAHQHQQSRQNMAMNAQGHMQRGPVLPGQQQQPGRMPNRTEVLLQRGLIIVENIKRGARPASAALQGPPRDLSEADKAQYPAAFAELLRLATDIERQLPMFAVVLPLLELREVMHIIARVSMQNNELALQVPQYYLDLPTIKHLQESLATHWRNGKKLLNNQRPATSGDHTQPHPRAPSAQDAEQSIEAGIGALRLSSDP
ncbi:hypothetical protein K474DRAFT_1723895 [Panus rudis PR-1116 ss-1]|nr:hypothetical protein K474DRAFT_1723895 [Panus rudis PR-1116 ss-1]